MRIPKALYVVFSSAGNPHADPVQVFTTWRRADRARRWGDQRLVTFTPEAAAGASERALLDAFEAWWRAPSSSVGSFPPPSVLDAATVLYGPPGGPAIMTSCEGASEDGRGGAS